MRTFTLLEAQIIRMRLNNLRECYLQKSPITDEDQFAIDDMGQTLKELDQEIADWIAEGDTIPGTLIMTPR